MRVVVAVAGPRGRRVADDLAAEGADVVAHLAPEELTDGSPDALTHTDLVVLAANRHTLTPDLVATCDRHGVRIVPLCGRDDERRHVALFGLVPLDHDATAREMLGAPTPPQSPAARSGRIITVWGAAGSPGRTTVAIELACELSRDGRAVALVDADSHAPSIALATGLADEGPGFAAACRQAERGALTPAELTRIASPLGAAEVLAGFNRPSRWPELSGPRVTAALTACREWTDDTVVDVAAPLERDEEIVSDIDGLRRNAATLAALGAADLVVAVVAADPVGVSRFVRAYPDVRAAAGTTPVKVIVNKLRSGVLGIDAKTQVRRTLERFAGVDDVWFAPWDGKAADAAMLSAAPIAHVAGRSSFASALRRFVGEAIEPPQDRRANRRSALAATARPRTRDRSRTAEQVRTA